MSHATNPRGRSRRVTLPRLLLLTLPLLALLGVACEPALPAKAPPVPGLVSLAGDSVLLQAGVYGGGWRGADYELKVGNGWEAQHAQPRLTADIADSARSPSVSVQAFGQNYGDRYQQAEKDQLMSLAFTPHEDACVVLVLPHPGIPGSHGVRISAVRQTLMELAQARPNTEVVDWSAVVRVHPEFLSVDGVHLSNTDADGDGMWDAAEAYLDLIWFGIARCGS